MLKAYQIGEDLYAANSHEEAQKLDEELAGGPCQCTVIELSDEQLDAPQPEFDEDERQTGETTTVRQMLREHGDEPGLLAEARW